jgi:hypothetical protein
MTNRAAIATGAVRGKMLMPTAAALFGAAMITWFRNMGTKSGSRITIVN